MRKLLISVFALIFGCFVLNACAKPTANLYVLVYDLDGGTGLSLLGEKVKEGETISLPENVSKEGYVFCGWKQADGDILPNDYTVKSDITLIAVWKKACRVTYDLNGGEGLSELAFDVAEGTQLTLPADIVKAGYSFDGWMVGGNIAGKTYRVTEDVAFAAIWIKTNEFDNPHTGETEGPIIP